MVRKVLHIRSSVQNSLPTAAQMDYGAIGVNYNADHEKLVIKNSNDEIVTFSSDTVMDNYLNERDIVIAASLNDLNDNKLSLTEAYSLFEAAPTVLEAYMTNSAEIDNDYNANTFEFVDNTVTFADVKSRIEAGENFTVKVYTNQTAYQNASDPLYVFKNLNISYPGQSNSVVMIYSTTIAGFSNDLKFLYFHGDSGYGKVVTNWTEGYKYLRMQFLGDYIFGRKEVWDAAIPGLTSLDSNVSSLQSTDYICFDPVNEEFVPQTTVAARVRSDVYTTVYVINEIGIAGGDGCLLKLTTFEELDPQTKTATCEMNGYYKNARLSLTLYESSNSYSFTDAFVMYPHISDINPSDVAKWNAMAYVPVIEDTRQTVGTVMTGNAPFASLSDGQRIILHLKYTAQLKLNLTLSNNTTTGNINVYAPYYSSAPSNSVAGIFSGGYMHLIYEETNNRWVLIGQRDTNTTNTNGSYSTFSTGTSTTGYLVQPTVMKQLLTHNDYAVFYARAYDNSGTPTFTSYYNFDGFKENTMTADAWSIRAVDVDSYSLIQTPFVVWYTSNESSNDPFVRVCSDATNTDTAWFTNVTPNKVRVLTLTRVYDSVNDAYDVEWSYSETPIGGAEITVDTNLSQTSTNPVENRAVYNAITTNEMVMSAALNDLNTRVDSKESKLIFDDRTSAQAVSPFTLTEDKYTDFGTYLPQIVKTGPKVDNDGYLKTYSFQFTATSSSQTITLKNSDDTNVLWSNGSAPETVSGRTYQISVANGLAVYGVFY